MNELGEDWIEVETGTEVILTNMDSKVMYKITTSSSSSKASSKDIETKSVFEGNEDEYHPIPNEKHKSNFKGRDVGIQSIGKIKIETLNTGNGDMIIDESDSHSYINKRGGRVWEEYYHIDFSESPYSELDKSRIALTIYSQGSAKGNCTWGYVTENFGEREPKGFTEGLYDFTNYSYVNLFSTMEIVSNSRSYRTQELIISNPINCDVGVKTELPSKCCVLSFNPEDKTKNYVLELNKSKGVTYPNKENYNPRFIDGIFSGFLYEISDTVCYLGKIEKELLVDMIMYSNEDTNNWGSVSLRPATTEEEKEYNSHLITITPNQKTFTVKLKKNDKGVYNLKAQDITLSNMIVKVDCRKEDGTFPTERMEIRLRSTDALFNLGWNQDTIIGPYYEFEVDNTVILTQMEFLTDSESPINITVTFEDSSEEITYNNNSRFCIVPNYEGASPYYEEVEMDSSFKVPVLERDGYTLY